MLLDSGASQEAEMTPLRQYLRDVEYIRSSHAGTKETSFYGPLETLLNAVGSGMKPAVRAVFQLADTGAGRPDFGLFSNDQFLKGRDPVGTGQRPSRGVGEVKGASQPLGALTKGKQVSRYWNAYRQVLVTNLRGFAFVSEDRHGEPIEVDRYELAESEADFWRLCARPDLLTDAAEADAVSFLERCLRHASPINEPRELAWFLASYAREARGRLEAAPQGTLDDLRDQLAELLNAQFDGERGQRFLIGTVVQTLFYGMFSAWVLWHNERPEREDEFTWRDAADNLRMPVLEALFHHVSQPGTIKALLLRDLLERTASMFARVRRDRFFARFQVEAEAIQYFYEPFLEAYDAQLRKDLGVWYTPPELVRYMVSRVDAALREHLGFADGLADERVVVLDPCCGTGAFLVEAMRSIRSTLEENYGAMAGMKLKQAVTKRLHGFELLTAPYVVAHLQIGLALKAAGVSFGPAERASVMLTNALTDWLERPHDNQHALSPAFREEVDRARHVKREERIFVVLGNPPYDGYAGVATNEEADLSNAYRSPRRRDVPMPQGQGLSDLYVRFFRMAERLIAEKTGRGIVCFVSNSSWLERSSHPAMRERMLDVFDGGIWIDNLNGDTRKTGKLTPEGLPDPSVFSTPSNREGIQVGTAVALMVRVEDETAPVGTEAAIHYRDFWGTSKLPQLAAAAQPSSPTALGYECEPYRSFSPVASLGLPFVPFSTAQAYFDWPALPDLFPAFFPGVFTARDKVVVDIDRDRLEARMTAYFDPKRSDEEIRSIMPEALIDTKRFAASQTRSLLLRRGMRPSSFVPYLYRPFDVRWLYWEPETKLLDEKRSEYVQHIFESNLWLGAVRQNRKEFSPPPFTREMASLHVIERGAGYFPLYLAADLTSDGSVRANLSKQASEYLTTHEAQPEALFYHSLAVMHAPAYRKANAGALRQDWPRIPLPESASALEVSAELGRRVAALLDTEAEVVGVTRGPFDTRVRPVAIAAHAGGGQLDDAAGDFRVTARWGYLGHTGQVMPGPGKIERHPLASPPVPASFGDGAVDIYLNEVAYWSGIPTRVWEYTLGGYQVLKKWLSYRTEAVLGRSLRADEVEAFTAMARRIAALLLLEDALDANYAAVQGEAYDEALLSKAVGELAEA